MQPCQGCREVLVATTTHDAWITITSTVLRNGTVLRCDICCASLHRKREFYEAFTIRSCSLPTRPGNALSSSVAARRPTVSDRALNPCGVVITRGHAVSDMSERTRRLLRCWRTVDHAPSSSSQDPSPSWGTSSAFSSSKTSANCSVIRSDNSC